MSLIKSIFDLDQTSCPRNPKSIRELESLRTTKMKGFSSYLYVWYELLFLKRLYNVININ